MNITTARIKGLNFILCISWHSIHFKTLCLDCSIIVMAVFYKIKTQTISTNKEKKLQLQDVCFNVYKDYTIYFFKELNLYFSSDRKLWIAFKPQFSGDKRFICSYLSFIFFNKFSNFSKLKLMFLQVDKT